MQNEELKINENNFQNNHFGSLKAIFSRRILAIDNHIRRNYI